MGLAKFYFMLIFEKFLICSNCNHPLHKNCFFEKQCVTCIPDFQPKHNSQNLSQLSEIDSCSDFNPIDDDYYNNLLIFNPFNDLESNISHGLTECDDVFDKFFNNSEILNACKHHGIKQFAQKLKYTDCLDKFYILGLNIDGFKTNLDSFRILNHILINAKI